MNELVKVNFENQTVSARDLHEALEVAERFSQWINRYSELIEEYGVTPVGEPTEVQNNGGIQVMELTDYKLPVDMAKHISMMSKTKKAKEVRQYFIDLEKAWNTPEQVMSRALKMADETINRLSNEVLALTSTIQEMQPKVTYYDKILESKDTMLVTQIAQDYGMSAIAFNRILCDLKIQHKVGGQWVVYSKYLPYGYTKSHTHAYEKTDGSTGTKANTEWTQPGRFFLYEKLKENGILPLIEQED